MNNEEEQLVEEPKEHIEIPTERVIPKIMDIDKYDWEGALNDFKIDADQFQNDLNKIDNDIKTIMQKIDSKQSNLMKDRATAEFVEDVMDLRSKYEQLLMTYSDFVTKQHMKFLEAIEIARKNEESISKLEKRFNELNETLGALQTLLIPYIDGDVNMTRTDYLRAVRNLIEDRAKAKNVETAEKDKELEMLTSERDRLRKRVDDLESRAEHTISLDALDRAVGIVGGKSSEPKKKSETGVPKDKQP